MENPSSHQPSSKQKPAIQVGIAILVGQIIVNLPAITVILVVTYFGINSILGLTKIFQPLPEIYNSLGVMILILIGALIAWSWWSFSVACWWKWALKNATPEDQLQKWAVLTGLRWPNGSVFEETVFEE